MFDKRLSWDQLTSLSSLYVMANCYHYANSTDHMMEQYENEIVNFIGNQSREIVPFICVDKQKKLIARDIAKNSLAGFVKAAEAKNSLLARQKIRDGVNALIQLIVGDQLFELLSSTLNPSLNSITSPINKITPVESVLIASASTSLKDKAINAGLLKP